MKSLADLKQKYDFNWEEFDGIQKEIIEEFTCNLSSTTAPRAIILGAQPGSGKTELEKIAFADLKRNAVICNVDNLRNYHPFSQEIKRDHPNYYTDITSEVAHKWNLNLRNYCIQNKLHFILETTFSNGFNINKIINNLKANKFAVEIYMLSVPSILSKLGVFIRFEETFALYKSGRKVLPEVHDERFEAIPNALKEVEKERNYDFISLFGRSELNYNLNENTGVYLLLKTRKSIYKDFMIERNQSFLPKTKMLVEKQIGRVVELMNNRNATIEEIESFSLEFGIQPERKGNVKKI